jgi:glycosyltransferase involved in cell wall biosynthesis
MSTGLFCSTIIPTIGRTDLDRAVESVLSQNISSGEFEVIVVNDSGKPLRMGEWRSSARAQLINTNRRERSIARNTGAAIARGRYLHFLDDDDWLAPGALQALWNLSQTSDAKWLYGISQLVNRQHKPILRLQHGMNGNGFAHVMAGEWIPLQSSLIEASTFFRVGGFNPLISGPEDIDLLRRVALVGDLAEVHCLIAYVVRGEWNSTTNYTDHAKASQFARERILDSTGVLPRLLASAKMPFLHGRILRLYLTSSVWNMRRRRLFKAMSRISFCIAGLACSGGHFFSPDYWRAVMRPYSSETFRRGYSEAGKLT